mmetsp:Transcript_60394/g.70643  ORF Transcript_60394/g.70643 Transcript_60394/m.70643 type:complete len:129 (+) Transcript_60394:578-964(+)
MLSLGLLFSIIIVVASYGGSLPLIDSIICRIYPRLFLETKTNSSEEESEGAGAVSKKTLSKLEKEDARKIFEKRRQLAMEKDVIFQNTRETHTRSRPQRCRQNRPCLVRFGISTRSKHARANPIGLGR